MPSGYVKNKITGEIKKVSGIVKTQMVPKDKTIKTDWIESDERKYEAYRAAPNKYKPQPMIKQ